MEVASFLFFIARRNDVAMKNKKIERTAGNSSKKILSLTKYLIL
jgi:hypothetical protein